MTDVPKLIFPQPQYPIRVVADSHEQLCERVVEVIKRHDPEFSENTVELVHSREGTYCSIRMVICATGEPQLQALHNELMSNPLVKMVL